MPVNWCPALGTVLANEEVVDGVSERGGHPVIRKVCQFYALLCCAGLYPNYNIFVLFYIFLNGFTMLQCRCLLPSSQCDSGFSRSLHMLTVFLKI